MSFYDADKLLPVKKDFREDRIHKVLDKIGVDHPMYNDCVACLFSDDGKEPIILPSGKVEFVN